MKEYENTIEYLFQNYATNLIITKDGREIGYLPNIELQYYDQNQRNIKWGSVQFIERHLVNKPLIQITLQSGNTITITQDHSLVVLRNDRIICVKPKEMQETDLFITLSGYSKLKSVISLVPQKQWVYDIQMKDNPHTFFSDGVLVHNSVFIKLKTDENSFKQELEQFNKNLLLEQLIKKYHPDIDIKYFQCELEHEKNLSYLYLGDRKKRYYSIQQDGSKYIHGLNIIKKDTPPYISKLLDQLCEKAVTGKFSVKDLQQVYQKLKTAELEEIAVHKSITKRFEKYNKTMPQHVAGALYANEHLGLKIQHSDVVYLFYINSFCEPETKLSERKNVICLRKQDFPLIKTTNKFEIDYNELMEKQFIQPLREFNKISQVQQAIEDWGKLNNGNYRMNNKGQFVFKKRKF